MRDFIYEIMTDYPSIVIYLHVLSAVVWVGGMIALKFLIKSVNQELLPEQSVITKALLIKKFFSFLVPFIVLLFVSAFFMALGYKDNAIDMDGFILDIHNLEVYKFITTKASIWIIMVMNMILMTWVMNKASSDLCKFQKSKDCMWLVSAYLLPINIILGLVAIYIGVYLRSLY